MRMLFLIALLAAGLLARPASAQSQSLTAPVPTRSVPFPLLETSAANDVAHLADATALRALTQAKDYRWEGFAIGAVGLGILGGVAAHGLCSEDASTNDSCVAGTIAGSLIGALVGGVTGGLIGGLIDKH